MSFRRASPLVCVLLAIVASPVSAQHRPAVPDRAPGTGMSHGVLGGLSIATLHGQDADGAKPRRGFAAGVFLEQRLGGTLAMRTELLFVQKGGNADAAPPTTGGVRISYVELPVLVRWGVRLNNMATLTLFGGPSVALRVACSMDIRDPAQNMVGDCSEPLSYFPVTRLDLGGTGGLELAVRSGSGLVSLSGRLTSSLGSIDGSVVVGTADIRNRAGLILLGYTFDP